MNIVRIVTHLADTGMRLQLLAVWHINHASRDIVVCNPLLATEGRANLVVVIHGEVRLGVGKFLACRLFSPFVRLSGHICQASRLGERQRSQIGKHAVESRRWLRHNQTEWLAKTLIPQRDGFDQRVGRNRGRAGDHGIASCCGGIRQCQNLCLFDEVYGRLDHGDCG